jgi:glycosyltransferase involved in cell wall biosynthesis
MKETKTLSVLVALHSGSMSGIDTYAEQVAEAAADAAHHVTLMAVGGRLATELERRLANRRIRVLATAAPAAPRWESFARQVPVLSISQMREQLARTLVDLGETFDVAHLNHPALAGAARSGAAKVVVAAWFYPHDPLGRVAETWRHTGAIFPKSGALAIKGLMHYWNDRRGFAKADCIVAPTDRLTKSLAARGYRVATCPPPGRQPRLRRDGDAGESGHARPATIVICCGDLAHPRKNVEAGIRAIGELARAGRLINLELVGRNADVFAKLIAGLPPSVAVVRSGPLAPGEVARRFSNADILLVPSRYEEWGYVATEALLAGTMVVAFPVYPFVEVLSRPLGLCARDLTPRSLARAIDEALASDSDRARVRSAATAKFGSLVIGRRLTQIWSNQPSSDERVLESRPAGARA